MTATFKTEVAKDFKENSFKVSREFNAPLANVWRAFTESKLLEQWWAPAPWRAETKTMNFSVGGYWHYAMVGPNDERHWARMNYLAIDRHKSIDVEDVFCDENGKLNIDLPASKGKMVFSKTAEGTFVESKIFYPSSEALKQILEMGMEQGIIMCFEQLSDLFEQGKL